MAETKPVSGMPLPDAMAGNFQEAARWFGQLWGDGGSAAGRGGPIPSVLMPTLDVKEIDKRISDLRSVEHWLQLNQGLLHSTIQGLEMQRNTLAAWQSFGAAATGAPVEGAPSGSGASDIPAFQPALWWAALQQQFAQMAAGVAAAQGTAAQDAGSRTEETPGGSSKPQPSGTPPKAGRTGGAGSG